MYSLIGLTGVAQSGKDTAAKILIEQHGYVRISFADALRKMLYALNPILVSGVVHDLRVRDVVHADGWDEAKKFPEVRQLLQRMGTEAGREVLGDDIWIKTAFREFDKDERAGKWVVTDVRFENEAGAIAIRSGILIKIERPGVGPVNNHVSDAGIDDSYIAHTIGNNSTVEVLQSNLLGIVIGDLFNNDSYSNF